MQFVADHRDHDKWWGLNQMKHGDLASMSNLDFLDKFYTNHVANFRRPKYNGPKNVNLYIHGDSYLYKMYMGDSVFAGVSSLYFIGWTSILHYHLDTTKRNIFIIEVSERLLREYYHTTKIIDEFHDTVETQGKTGVLRSAEQGQKYGSFIPGIISDNFFNKFINQNLQCNIFNYNWIKPMYGSKAALNYYLFDRASGDVIISKDKQYLLLRQTLVPVGNGSSLSPVSDDEISLLVNNFNEIYDYYRGTGFTEIYLSIIPNTATIVQPDGYNNLIPRVQNDPRLKMAVIDIYSVFKQTKEKVFLPGDTHWNNTGKQMWFDTVNKILVGK
jgi:hypothetical protein